MKEITPVLEEDATSLSSAVTVTVKRPGFEVDDVELDFFLVTVMVIGSLLSSVVAGASESMVDVTVIV